MLGIRMKLIFLSIFLAGCASNEPVKHCMAPHATMTQDERTDMDMCEMNYFYDTHKVEENHE